jgi:dTDP-4-dehydrorhamnose reductase
MRVLLTGGTGLLGWTLLQKMPPEWEVVVAVHRNHIPPLGAHIRPILMDLTSRQQVREAVRWARPDVIIHTASIGDLDANERRQEEAWQVNVEGTRFLLEESLPYEPLFVFCSTIYVFDGTEPPYAEDAVPNPINFYARCKLAGERLAQRLAHRLLLLRPNTTYGWHLPGQRPNWVTWLLAKLSAGQPVKVVDDVHNNYVWVGDVADIILAGIIQGVTGVFHVGGPESMSRYVFSLHIADVFGYPRDLISPVSSDYFASLAPRPRSAICSIEKMVRVLGIRPLTVLEGLELMKRQEEMRVRLGREYHELVSA